MDKHVGDKLPVHMMMAYIDRIHGQIGDKPAVERGEHEDYHIGYDDIETPVVVDISESGGKKIADLHYFSPLRGLRNKSKRPLIRSSTSP